MMKRNYLIFLLSLLISSTTWAQITIDANLEDWGDTTLRFEDKGNLLRFDYQQDETFLYIAFFKPEYATKAVLGGVQLRFDKGKITDKSLMLTFGFAFPDPENPKQRLAGKDFLQLENFEDQAPLLLPIYNSYGVTASTAFLHDNSHMKDKKADGMIELHKIGKNKSIFKAEVAIPKAMLTTLDGKINMEICLRGMDLKKTGNALAAVNAGLSPGNSVYEQEANDKISFSTFTTTLLLP